jgi:beta-galactosidase
MNANWKSGISRRRFVRGCATSAATLASTRILGHQAFGQNSGDASGRTGATARIIPLNTGWLFGGKFDSAATYPQFNDASFTPVTLPHCVAKLSWQNWDFKSWHDVWIYRRHFDLPKDAKGLRVFVRFDGVSVGATPTINGATLGQHLGGYLPFDCELTQYVKEGDNVLAVAVDSRWLNAPPDGAAVGPRRVDYLEAGGICRTAHLKLFPSTFIRDLFAKPVKVLDSDRHIEVVCTLDAAAAEPQPVQLRVELRQQGRVLGSAVESTTLDQPGQSLIKFSLSKLGDVALWDVNAPHLYDVVATLLVKDQPVHDYSVRIGLREARFELDGFYLNGRRLQIFGLNRHEIYPYVGFAMPARVMRRDAQILKHQFNCNMVRCSHYPQSEAFLDACDELGLMVWEETPGWGYLGDEAWKELLVQNVHDMIVRDRNHPAIVIWGTRANESANDVPLYKRTRELAASLDDSRPTSGSMTSTSRKTRDTWHQDVFSFDDYHARPDGTVDIEKPVAGVPYMLSEAVGQFNYTNRRRFDSYYRRAGDLTAQMAQALRHAQAHSRAGADKRICGVIAWCAFDYASLVNPYHNVKTPGVADSFRIPKLGASFYQAQLPDGAQAIIVPNFYWDFGKQSPRGPGKDVAIFSNCDRLDLFINGQKHATSTPDTQRYPNLRHPPYFADLDLDGSSHPGLRIDGYVGNRMVLSRSFSSDPSHDQLSFESDDKELLADGSDATRLVFKVVDKFGADRLDPEGEVKFDITGPADLVGDNPFALADSGGVGAIWVRSKAGATGHINVTATHSTLGAKTVEIDVRESSPSPSGTGQG